MKFGHIIIEYYAEFKVPKDKFTVLNQNNIEWYPSMDLNKANDGWVWFDKPKEYFKAKRLIREK